MEAPQRLAARTESVCTAELVRGSHSFKIFGYSLYRQQRGRPICSGDFAVGGHQWRVLFFPDGAEDAPAEFASVYLELASERVEVRVAFDFRFLDIATGLPSPVVLSSAPTDFDAERWCFGSESFIRKAELEATYVRNDCLVIECDLSVLKEPRVGCTLAPAEVQVPPPDLSADLVRFLESEEEADVVFKVKDEVFRAHRVLLAMRSPVFKAELCGPMREKGKDTVTVQDMEPAVFKGLLHFIYSDSLPAMEDDEEMIKRLLVAADRYAMERMKLMCENLLAKKLRANNAAAILALANQHHCNQLKDVCIGFITSAQKISDVVATEGYQHLKRACPSIILDIWEKAAKSRNI